MKEHYVENQLSQTLIQLLQESKPPVELVVCSAAISRLFRPGPKAH
ncbi:hypothetical protein ACTGXW_10455 [Streptococcus suis]